jgi:hypothetical protein
MKNSRIVYILVVNHDMYITKTSFSQLVACTEQNKSNHLRSECTCMEHINIRLQRSLLFTEFLSCFRYADYISLMSFDYHTATSDNVTGLNSPLHAIPEENRNNTKLNVVSACHQSTFLMFLFIKAIL